MDLHFNPPAFAKDNVEARLHCLVCQHLLLTDWTECLSTLAKHILNQVRDLMLYDWRCSQYLIDSLQVVILSSTDTQILFRFFSPSEELCDFLNELTPAYCHLPDDNAITDY